MSKRLNDDILFIHEDNIPISKQFYTEGAFAMFGIKSEKQDTIKAKLLDSS